MQPANQKPSLEGYGWGVKNRKDFNKNASQVNPIKSTEEETAEQK